MRKLAALLSVTIVCSCMHIGTAFADSAPSCALLKFNDDTRFDRIESAATLSDLLLEKILASGKFNFKETKVIDENLEKRLYDERSQEFENAAWAMNYGNYSVLFEGAGFNEAKAQSITTATVGQYVSPKIIADIGLTNKADYLIQGTIINLGTGNWMDDKVANVIRGANMASTVMGSAGVGNLLGPVGALANSLNVKKTGIGVQADMRLIKASTGDVVWYKRVTGTDTQKQFNVGFIKIGSDKLNNDMYYKAMNATAQLITDALVADLDAGKLFLK